MRRFLAAAVLVFAAACNSDSAVRADTVPGTYALQSVNGAGLPYVLQPTNPRVELVSDQFLINSDGTFSEVGQTRTTPSGGSSTTDPFNEYGTWSVSGNQVFFRFSDSSTENGTISGSEITFSTGNGSAIYRKQ